MKFQKIQTMAKNIGINSYGKKKPELIWAIQRAEHNIDCFGTQRVAICHEEACLWKADYVNL